LQTNRGLLYISAISDSRLIPEHFDSTRAERRLLQRGSHNTRPTHHQRLRQSTHQLICRWNRLQHQESAIAVRSFCNSNTDKLMTRLRTT